MEPIAQLFQDKSLVQIIESCITILGVCGIGIEFTPFIKLNPVSWLLAWLGRALNKESFERIEQLSKKMDDLSQKQDKLAVDQLKKRIDDLRWNILNFANTCRNHVKHSREEFAHVIDSYKEYEKILKENGMENGQVDADFKFIMEIYNECMHNNSFL